MSLVELRRPNRSEAVSGGGMDRVVEHKRIDKRLLIGGAVGAALLLILLFWLFAPRSGSESVSRDRLTIATAESGVFEDFLPLRARVTPLVTVYLDAVEGGRVEKKLVEDGAQVTEGQPLAVSPKLYVVPLLLWSPTGIGFGCMTPSAFCLRVSTS